MNLGTPWILYIYAKEDIQLGNASAKIDLRTTRENNGLNSTLSYYGEVFFQYRQISRLPIKD